MTGVTGSHFSCLCYYEIGLFDISEEACNNS